MAKRKWTQLEYVVEVYLDDKWQIAFTSDEEFAAEKFWKAQVVNGIEARLSNKN